MPNKILCVAEKNSIAKAVAGHLSGGVFQTGITRNQYIKNYSFDFDFGPPWGHCDVVMTSVAGHLTDLRFGPQYKDWTFPPPEALFQAPLDVFIQDDKLSISENITKEARFAKGLFIWTDCDREGEHIGAEVRAEALKGNPCLQVKRAKFSNIERVHVLNAARHPVILDEAQVNAVDARRELDLRIGFAFSRFLCNSLRPLGGVFSEITISYGPCQFPTLGFVVDRYFRVKNFVPEAFWSIKITHRRENTNVLFSWRRHRIFDRAIVTILFERCLAAKMAKVTKVQEKPTKKWKPLPLTTVEFQKMASRFLRMNSQVAMATAEKLYQKGFISYPRTETDRFDKGMDLRSLVQKQVNNDKWGPFAQNLINGAFQQPREGRNDDKAHPPIHPVIPVASSKLTPEEDRVYEFITRRFLACCSEDANGQATDVEIGYGDEVFHAHGLVVLERNYLDVYPYEKWNSSTPIPRFTLGERFEPTEAMMNEGKTAAPGYLTEPELLALMDANGIGTDATMAEHINTIKQRQYAETRPQAVSARFNDEEDKPATAATRGGRGGRGGRGRGGGNGGNNARGGAGGVEEFIPTTLGVALVDGYDCMGFEISLSKPYLRKEQESRTRDICEGRLTREAVIRETVRQYREVLMESKERVEILKASCRRYVLNGGR